MAERACRLGHVIWTSRQENPAGPVVSEARAMVRLITAVSVVAIVGACSVTSQSGRNQGGVRSAVRAALPSSTPPVLFASGPISSACRSAGRKQASRERCGCVQAVADRSLSAGEQRRGAAFFRDPQKAQDTRQSDNASNERFWLNWKAYSAEAAKLCT